MVFLHEFLYIIEACGQSPLIWENKRGEKGGSEGGLLLLWGATTRGKELFSQTKAAPSRIWNGERFTSKK